jgi:hypothetical protein
MLPYLKAGRESAMKEAAQYRGEKCQEKPALGDD